MSFQQDVLLFPHELKDVLGAVHDLSVRAKTNTQLHRYLDSACLVLREQDSASKLLGHTTIGAFDDLVELSERHLREGQQSPVIEAALLVTVQTGRLLVLAETDSSILSRQSVALGYGLGVIAKAVAEKATDVNSAASLGLRAIEVAFRLAVELRSISRDIDESSSSWAKSVPKGQHESVEQQLLKVNAGLRPLHQAYIGQVMVDSIVVFGPPSTLDELGKRSDLELVATSSPYHCVMHSPYIPSINTSRILNNTSAWLQDAVLAIAHEPVNVKEALEGLATAFEDQGVSVSGIKLTTVGSLEDASVIKGLFGIPVTLSGLPPCPKPYGDAQTIPSDAIAIVGMSGRFPESDTLDELLSLLMAGRTTHREIPSSRFDVDAFYDPSSKKHNALVQRYGCFIRTPDLFDHRLFNISPKEAMQMDPVQRMLLMTTFEALEMAGYSDNDVQTPPRIATYFGQTIDDWKTINEQRGIDTHFLPAVNRGFAPGRLNHFFRWAGGFYSIDTGCSSSATSICLARDALADGTIDAAVVGGGTLLAAPEWFSGLGQGGFLSPSGACKTYTDQADGYCRGEGVAVVVLKRLVDAVRSKDNVLAVIGGASRNTNAGEGSITHPGAKAQEALYRRTLRQAGLRPSEVNVIEMHGTGTQAGDRTETTAVRNVFAPLNEPKRAQPPIVGALKANIGHSEAAAGVVSLIKAVLLLHSDKLPPQPNLDTMKLNPYLMPILGPGGDMQLSNGQAWPHSGSDPRYVFINNFDAAGGNVSFLIHEAPTYAKQLPPSKADERLHHVVVTSARTEKALQENRQRLRQYLMSHPETQIASLAYTTTARKMHLNLKDSFVATSVSDLVQQLERPAKAQTPAGSVIFAFSGQGSQYIGMGNDLYTTSASFRRMLDSYQSVLTASGIECDFLRCIRGSVDADSVDSIRINRDMQVATVALEIALARYWQALGFQPKLLIGHSLGEYAALCIAGVISVDDALALSYERAELISARCKPSQHCMMAVSLPAHTLRWRIRDLPTTTSSCEICCVNGPSSTVVGGPVAAIDTLQKYLESGDNASCTRLRTQHAFHTKQMEPLLGDLEAYASKIVFKAPTVPVASTLLASVVDAGNETVFNATYIRRHTREPVAFVETVRACEAQNLIDDSSFVIEIGPNPTVINLLAAALKNAKPSRFPSLRRGHNDWESISNCLAGAYSADLPISWSQFHQDHLDSVQLLSKLPHYAFDMQSFWTPYQTQIREIAAPATSTAPSKLLSSTLHSVEQLKKEGSILSATFMAELSDHHLATAIGGHVVDGVAITPASIFIDMAYTAAAYLDIISRSVSEVSLSAYTISSLELTSPMVLRPGMTADELPRVLVEGSLNEVTNIVTIRFLSRKGAVGPVGEHGSCAIDLCHSTDSSVKTWSYLRPLIEARVATLESSSRPHQVYAFDRRLFYGVFGQIVDYAPPYHAVEDAIVAANFGDAVFTFQLPPNEHLGSYTCSPFLVDAAVHVAGFLLNADPAKSKDVVHIANHIGSFQVLGDLTPSLAFRAYATIREQDPKTGISICDVYVTDLTRALVIVCTDICFRKLDRDFFALLTGSNRVPPSRAITVASPSTSREASSINSSVASSPSLSTTSDSINLADELLTAVAERSGIDMSELKFNRKATFADLGIDSQMSIQILSDFNRSTAVELPAAFFTNFPTVQDVEKQLGESLNDLELLEAKPKKFKSGNSTPRKEQSRGRSHKQSPSPVREGPSKKLFAILAEALGLDTVDFKPALEWSATGLDSMLSIRALSSFNKETGIELPAAFFTIFPTVGAAQKELDGAFEPEPFTWASASAKQTSPALAPAPAVRSAREEKIETSVSRAVLIQGSSRSKTAPLFMTTDGSGTVESYIHLKALPEGRRIYALESPFLLETEKFDFTIEEMARIFVRTIRRIQPAGPYLIGGWSAGSIYAYEVAHSLVRAGEEILGLVILDMRAPSLIPTSIVTDDFVDQLGTFEGINRARDLPEDLSIKEKAHLMATCRALSKYDAPPFPADKRPRHSAVVWAKLGLDNRPDAPEACMCGPGVEIGKALHEMDFEELRNYFNSWFYGRRSTFGRNGWEKYLGDAIDVHVVDGDHFSMMTPPFSAQVGDVVVDAVKKATMERGVETSTMP